MRLQSAIFHHVCANLCFNWSARYPENWLTSLSVPFRGTLGAQSQVSATMWRDTTSLKKSYCSAKLFLGFNTLLQYQKNRKNIQTCQSSTCPPPTFWFHTSLRTLVPQKKQRSQRRENIKTCRVLRIADLAHQAQAASKSGKCRSYANTAGTPSGMGLNAVRTLSVAKSCQSKNHQKPINLPTKSLSSGCSTST